MSGDLPDGPIPGDGVITIPIYGDSEMADLSPEVSNLLLAESATNMQQSNRNSRGVFDAVMGAIAGTVQTNFAEVGTLEGRAVSGVNATPIAPPATP